MKRILVATDHSEPAKNAVRYAAHLSKEMGAELVLFNVYKLSIHAGNAMVSLESIDNLKKVNEERLIEVATELNYRYGIDVTWKLGMNDPIDSLSEIAKETPLDLVVMGIESNLTEYKMFGNTTTDAIKLRKFPILVVPHEYEFDGIGNIMYACESAYIKDGCTLNVLKEFTTRFDAQLEVFHVLSTTASEDKDRELEAIVDDILGDVPHEYRYVKNAKVGDGIAEGLKAFPADLLVMVPHKIGFFESLIKGSQTSHMTVRTKVPLLVIPNLNMT